MAWPLDIENINVALTIARRLALSGPEGLSILRELLASLVDSKQLFRILKTWFIPWPATVSVYPPVLRENLTHITRELSSSGFQAEAVRVMTTGAELPPEQGAEFVEVLQDAVSLSPSKPLVERAMAAAVGLKAAAIDLLEKGDPEGIILIGAANRVAPSLKLPIQEIEASVEKLPARQPPVLETADAQVLTNVAYDLHFSGHAEAACRVGAVVSSLLPTEDRSRFLKKVMSSAKAGNEVAVDLCSGILDKGYPYQSTTLLLDSGAILPKRFWKSFNEEIGDPKVGLKTPNRFNFYVRSGKIWVDETLAKQKGTEPDVPKNFYFALEGDSVRCDQVVWGTSFDLVFHYDVPPAEVIAMVKGRKLDELLQGKIDLDIHVDPQGLTLSGDARGVASFEGGKMTSSAPRFRFLLAEKGANPGLEKYGTAIEFFVNRALIYRFFLAIRPVDKLDMKVEEGCKRTVDLDLEEVMSAKPEPRDAILFITKQGSSWQVYYQGDGVYLPPQTAQLSPSALAQAYKDKGIIEDVTSVANNPVWKAIDANLKITGPELEDETRKCTRTLMAVGSKLYKMLTDDTAFKAAFKEIEKLAGGAKITVVTEGEAFPWELLYPEYYDANDPDQNYQPDKFWGKRFQIEQLLYTKTEEEKLPRLRIQPDKLHVSMGLNESIDKDWTAYPLQPVRLQIDYCDKTLSPQGEHTEDQAQITRILKEAYATSFIYFFCHGDENHLKFEESKMPIDFQSLSPIAYPGWPIVFLNACSAGNISPLSFSSFRTRFREKKAFGVVAPSFPIPTLFAALFGKTVLEKYAARRPIGQILFDERSRLLGQNNPLGLLYSLQCPLDVIAPLQ